MKGFPTREQVEKTRALYPVGTRVVLNSMDDPYAPVPPGTEGVVQGVDDAGQILMKWNNGRGLSLIPGVDSFQVLVRPTPEQTEPEQEIGGMKFE